MYFKKFYFLFMVNFSAAELQLTQQRDGLLNFDIKDFHYDVVSDSVHKACPLC